MVALRRRLHELRADPALRAVLLEVLPARRTQARGQARVKSERVSERWSCAPVFPHYLFLVLVFPQTRQTVITLGEW